MKFWLLTLFQLAHSLKLTTVIAPEAEVAINTMSRETHSNMFHPRNGSAAHVADHEPARRFHSTQISVSGEEVLEFEKLSEEQQKAQCFSPGYTCANLPVLFPPWCCKFCLGYMPQCPAYQQQKWKLTTWTNRACSGQPSRICTYGNTFKMQQDKCLPWWCTNYNPSTGAVVNVQAYAEIFSCINGVLKVKYNCAGDWQNTGNLKKAQGCWNNPTSAESPFSKKYNGQLPCDTTGQDYWLTA